MLYIWIRMRGTSTWYHCVYIFVLWMLHTRYYSHSFESSQHTEGTQSGQVAEGERHSYIAVNRNNTWIACVIHTYIEAFHHKPLANLQNNWQQCNKSLVDKIFENVQDAVNVCEKTAVSGGGAMVVMWEVNMLVYALLGQKIIKIDNN